jgi:hypothetical protein
LGYRHAQQERNRTMIRSKPEMKPKPGELVAVCALGTIWWLRHIRNCAGRLANGPPGVVEVRPGSGRVRGDAHPPAPIQNQRGAQPGRIENRRFLSGWWRRRRSSPVSKAGKPRMRLQGKTLHCAQQEHRDCPMRCPTHYFLRNCFVLFNLIQCGARSKYPNFPKLIPLLFPSHPTQAILPPWGRIKIEAAERRGMALKMFELSLSTRDILASNRWSEAAQVFGCLSRAGRRNGHFTPRGPEVRS